MNVLIVGHVCIDNNVSEKATYHGPGSALIYMADYFHNQLDITPALLAPYGRDFLQYGKDLKLLTDPEGDHTLLYKNITRNNRRFQQCEHIEAAQPIPLTDQLLSYAREADIICVAPLLPNYPAEYVRQLLSAKKPGCVTVLSPQGYLRNIDSRGHIYSKEFKEAVEIIPRFDLVILSEDDHTAAQRLAGQWARAASSQTYIIMTRGPFGASLITADGVTPVGTKPVPEHKIVDSVGCGDTFSAAAAYSYLQKPDVLAAIKAGNQAAGAKLFRAGPAANQELA